MRIDLTGRAPDAGIMRGQIHGEIDVFLVQDFQTTGNAAQAALLPKLVKNFLCSAGVQSVVDRSEENMWAPTKPCLNG